VSDSLVALGCAPHSGWAAVVAVGEVHARLRVLVRERIEMADPREPGSRQPYHAVEGLPVAEAALRLAVYEAGASTMAEAALLTIAGRLAEGGHRLTGIGILDSAGRKGGALAATLASHARIHAADGEHFRAALARGADKCGLRVLRVAARALEAEAGPALGKSPRILRRTIQELGRDVGPPWTTDQKSAALLAWVVCFSATAESVGES
jgi:hypothetical protein